MNDRIIVLPEDLSFDKLLYFPYRVLCAQWNVFVYYRASGNVLDEPCDTADLHKEIFELTHYTPDNSSEVQVAPGKFRTDLLFPGIIRLILNVDTTIKNTFYTDMKIVNFDESSFMYSPGEDSRNERKEEDVFFNTLPDYRDEDGKPARPFNDRKTIL